MKKTGGISLGQRFRGSVRLCEPMKHGQDRVLTFVDPSSFILDPRRGHPREIICHEGSDGLSFT